MQTSTYKDMMGRWVAISHSPKRIISLVPSQTELLFDLGLDEEVVGITKFCEHPNAWRKQKTIVGGTKKVDYNIIDQLAPDLIIANKEENTKEMIAALEAKYPVWISDVTTKIENELMIEHGGALDRAISEFGGAREAWAARGGLPVPGESLAEVLRHALPVEVAARNDELGACIAAGGSAAASVVLAHNHPSGTAQPSRADEDITRTLKSAKAFSCRTDANI